MYLFTIPFPLDAYVPMQQEPFFLADIKEGTFNLQY